MAITFYYRPQCGLCKEIEEPLRAYAAQYGLPINSVNIDEDRAAWTRYWDKIPVIEIDEGTIFYEPIPRQALHDAIRRAAGRPTT